MIVARLFNKGDMTFNRNIIKRWILCLSMSIVVVFLSYIINNLDKPFSDGEKRIVKAVENYRNNRGKGTPYEDYSDKCLLINTSFDKILIKKYDEYGFEIGREAVTDRALLTEFLRILDENNNYNLIVVDIDMSNSIVEGQDSAFVGENRDLANLISTMNRVLVSQPVNDKGGLEPMLDSSLNSKTALASYVRTYAISDMVAIPLMTRGLKTIPFRMAEISSGAVMGVKGIFYTYGDYLCRKKVIPVQYLSYGQSDSVMVGEMPADRTVYFNLGADIMANPDEIVERCEDKIIMIGDFENDLHDTYYGTIPGAVILLNAYFSILNGWHLVHWWWVVVLVIAYSLVFYCTLFPDVLLLKRLDKKVAKVLRFITKYVLTISIVIFSLKVIALYMVHTDYYAATAATLFAIVIAIYKLVLFFKEKVVMPIYNKERKS